MFDNLKNRKLDTRPRGRPPAAEPVLAPPEPIEMRGVPALVPPCCGRANVPRVIRKRPDGRRDCTCTSCGRAFVWTPPTVALKVDPNQGKTGENQPYTA